MQFINLFQHVNIVFTQFDKTKYEDIHVIKHTKKKCILFRHHGEVCFPQGN